jgi:bifunctional non-homologous end joining protein LigD
MPDRVEPCLALLQSKPPEGDDWAFEVKWDGYRLAVHVEHGKVSVITRGGHDWTARFPTIAHDVRELGLDTAVLDGEAVVLDNNGVSDFGALQKALEGAAARPRRAARYSTPSTCSTSTDRISGACLSMSVAPSSSD